MFDAETNEKITIRDLLSHSSGLNRTDLAMITGRLTRAELIEVAAQARPTAKFRERFQYQNLMFTAAGEVVAAVEKMPWEKVVPEKVFKPLGMTNSSMSIEEMAKAADKSFGYQYNFDTKETQRLPFREIKEVAPAGSINSSANDMSRWLRFILAGGELDGKRIVSEASFAEWLKPQMKVTPNGSVNYGLGWFIRDWNGKAVVEHGGNIDGFNALVAMIPEEKLGFVMLTNVSASPLGTELMPIVWEGILGAPKKEGGGPGPVAIEKEAGKYHLAEGKVDFVVEVMDGGLKMTVPGQPQYPLEHVEGRKYKLGGAPDGFFVTFKDKELFLEQPQGNYTLARVGGDAAAVQPSVDAKELIGRYLAPDGNSTIEIKDVEGKVSLIVTGQQPYALEPNGKDSFRMMPLPDSYQASVKRTEKGEVEAVILKQPQGEFSFKRIAGEGDKLDITVDELMAKSIEASGGEANIRKLSSRRAVADIDFENQGVKAVSTSYALAPNKAASETTMTALGKVIAVGYDFFDGTGGEDAYSFAPVSKYSGKRLANTRIGADFYGALNWKKNYERVELVRKAKCGEEECYVVELEPAGGTKITEFISAKTFLPVRREGVIPSSTSGVELPFTLTFEDYREVDGVMIPFKTVHQSMSNGRITSVIREVKHNVKVDEKLFRSREVKLPN
jgi:CubicO group peptidase (beta-lactamase class C family)